MTPKIIKKPWGWEEIWADVPGKYLGKTININMKQRLSLQHHEKKEETIYVIICVLEQFIDFLQKKEMLLLQKLVRIIQMM